MFAYYMRRDSYKQCRLQQRNSIRGSIFLDKIFCTLN